MIDVKKNFPNKYGDDIACRTCKVQVESQEHLLKCEEIKKRVEIPEALEYEDIFDDVEKQLEAVKVYREVLRTRGVLLNT